MTQTAKLKARLSHGFFSSEACSNMLPHLLFDMKAQLVIEFVFHNVAAEKRT